jgi:8-oxo-dGTP pyrophosphatase MutT (NUDIX family)
MHPLDTGDPAAVDIPPRAAATVVLLRDATGADGRTGVEAFMLKRHGEDSVLAGAYVFPGGKIDREDAEPEAVERLGQAPGVLRDRLGEPELDEAAAAAVFMAAFRETFEETGVLLATGADRTDADRASALCREGLGFVEVLEHLDLRLDPSRLCPWSRWITPRVPTMMRKRFDTRFLVALMPSAQQAHADERESAGGEWLAPRTALRRYWDREIDLAAPQIMTLAHLSRFDGIDAVIAESRRRPPPLIQPQPYEVEGGRLLCYPGDERHPVRERVMPGPTRMVFSQGRFLPEGGFDAWFS